jgi:hypothetical protein
MICPYPSLNRCTSAASPSTLPISATASARRALLSGRKKSELSAAKQREVASRRSRAVAKTVLGGGGG